jgi:hypothetical protein
MKGWKKIYQDNGPPKQTGVAILEVDFKPKLEEKRRSLHSNKRRNTSTGNNNYQLICANAKAPKFIKHTLMDLKSQIDPSTVVVGHFNPPLSPIDKSSRKKINKEILELNDTIDLMESTEYSILQQYNIHSSPKPMELSPIQTISYVTKQVSTNIRKSK